MRTYRRNIRAGALALVTIALLTAAAAAARAAERAGDTKPAGSSSVPLGFAGWDNGFFVRSADGAFQLKLRGHVHADSRWWLDEQDDVNDDQFVIRRARPIIEGTVYEHVAFRIMPDFGDGRTVLQDAWADVGYWSAARLRAGKFKTPFGIERLRSATAINFVERALSDNFVPNRDLGLELHADLAGGRFSYSVAILNGVVDGASTDADLADAKDVVARVFVHPFAASENDELRGFGIGLATTYGREFGDQSSPNLPQYRTQGRTRIFQYSGADTAGGLESVEANGDRYRFSPQGYWYTGPLGILWEYVSSSQEVQRRTATGTDDDAIRNSGWQVNASWVLTGEKNSYQGVSPGAPLGVEPRAVTNWGAWELSSRYSALDIDEDAFDEGFASRSASVSEADAYGASLTWHLNKSVKFVVNYELTQFEDGGGTDGSDREDEHVVFGRLQFAI